MNKCEIKRIAKKSAEIFCVSIMSLLIFIGFVILIVMGNTSYRKNVKYSYIKDTIDGSVARICILTNEENRDIIKLINKSPTNLQIDKYDYYIYDNEIWIKSFTETHYYKYGDISAYGIKINNSLDPITLNCESSYNIKGMSIAFIVIGVLGLGVSITILILDKRGVFTRIANNRRQEKLDQREYEEREKSKSIENNTAKTNNEKAVGDIKSYNSKLSINIPNVNKKKTTNNTKQTVQKNSTVSKRNKLKK